MRLHRRDVLKFAAAGAAVGMGSVAGLSVLPASAAELKTPTAEALGWRLGCQAYSFNRFTFFEAVDKTASVGLKWIEAYPGQKMSKDDPAKIGPGLTPEQRKAVKDKLAEKGVTLVNFGVVGASKEVFDFAKDMGIETIVSEPDPQQFDEIEKLCDQYEINVALHNHPKPSRYWNPDVVLEAVKGRSKRLGACCDTGHWLRSDLDPIEQLRKLEGRIVSFHFKDLNQKGRGAHDVPWGTGVADVKGMLAEILRQKIKAVFSIEYEYNWENSLPEIAQCVENFEKVAKELSGG